MKIVTSALLYVGTFLLGTVIAAITLFSLGIALPDQREMISGFVPIGMLGLGLILVVRLKRRREAANSSLVANEIAPKPAFQTELPSAFLSRSSTSHESTKRTRFPTWARVMLGMFAVYTGAYFAFSPMLKDDASRFLRQKIAGHYSIAEIKVPFLFLISDRTELIALISNNQTGDLGSIPMEVAGHCLLGRCAIGARNIFLLPYTR